MCCVVLYVLCCCCVDHQPNPTNSPTQPRPTNPKTTNKPTSLSLSLYVQVEDVDRLSRLDPKRFATQQYGVRWQLKKGQSSRSLPSLFSTHSTTQDEETAQHSTAQHSTAQHSTAQHSTAQHSTAQHSKACDGSNLRTPYVFSPAPIKHPQVTWWL